MTRSLMLLVIGLTITGCGNDNLPVECQITMKKYNNLIDQAKNPQYRLPSFVVDKMKQERDNLKNELKKLDTAQAIQVCKQVNVKL